MVVVVCSAAAAVGKMGVDKQQKEEVVVKVEEMMWR